MERSVARISASSVLTRHNMFTLVFATLGCASMSSGEELKPGAELQKLESRLQTLQILGWEVEELHQLQASLQKVREAVDHNEPTAIGQLNAVASRLESLEVQAVESLARRYRVEAYRRFQNERESYMAHREAWRRVEQAWREEGAANTDLTPLLHWLQSSRTALSTSAAPLPPPSGLGRHDSIAVALAPSSGSRERNNRVQITNPATTPSVPGQSLEDAHDAAKKLVVRPQPSEWEVLRQQASSHAHASPPPQPFPVLSPSRDAPKKTFEQSALAPNMSVAPIKPSPTTDPSRSLPNMHSSGPRLQRNGEVARKRPALDPTLEARASRKPAVANPLVDYQATAIPLPETEAPGDQATQIAESKKDAGSRKENADLPLFNRSLIDQSGVEAAEITQIDTAPSTANRQERSQAAAAELALRPRLDTRPRTSTLRSAPTTAGPSADEASIAAQPGESEEALSAVKINLQELAATVDGYNFSLGMLETQLAGELPQDLKALNRAVGELEALAARRRLIHLYVRLAGDADFILPEAAPLDLALDFAQVHLEDWSATADSQETQDLENRLRQIAKQGESAH